MISTRNVHLGFSIAALFSFWLHGFLPKSKPKHQFCNEEQKFWFRTSKMIWEIRMDFFNSRTFGFFNPKNCTFLDPGLISKEKFFANCLNFLYFFSWFLTFHHLAYHYYVTSSSLITFMNKYYFLLLFFYIIFYFDVDFWSRMVSIFIYNHYCNYHYNYQDLS